jgi:hypothetical protein
LPTTERSATTSSSSTPHGSSPWRVAIALLVAGLALGFAVRLPALGWLGLVLTSYAVATPLRNRALHAGLVAASSLVASLLRFGFVWPGLRLYGAGDDAAIGALGLGTSIGIVDRLPIVLVLVLTPMKHRARVLGTTPLWMPSAWLLGERGMAWVTTMALNGWLLTQAGTPPVVHLVSWIGQTPTALIALTLGAVFGTAVVHREKRALIAASALALASFAIPARHTDARALEGVAALRLQRRADQVRNLDATLIVWPEGISRRRVSLEEGAVDVQVTPPGTTPATHVMGILNRRGDRIQNSAIAMTNEGHVYWHRAKIALAGMGEETRFGIRLGNDQDYLRGEIDPVVRVGERRVGVLICSEVFDVDMRERATPEGVDLVLVLAGDSITGDEASGRDLMLNAAILAAAEQGVSIARASLRGVAALIGPDGTVYARVDSGHLHAAVMPAPSTAP